MKGFVTACGLIFFIVLLSFLNNRESEGNPIIIFLSSDEVTAISVVATLLSFILSIWLIIITKNINKTINWIDQIKRFNDKREIYSQILKAHRDTMIKDKKFDEILISDLIIEVNKFKDFNSINNLIDKWLVYRLLRHLNKDMNRIDKSKLNRQITYIISKYNNKKGGII